MLLSNYQAQEEKYNFISSQHGGYYRYDFVDHAYLYNLYFPPEEIFAQLKDQIYNLVRNYPVAQDVLAELVGKVINQPSNRIVVGNGAAELIKIVSEHVADKLIVPVPSFNEYANAALPGHVVEFPLEFPSFRLDAEKFAAEARRVQADVAVVVTPNNPTSLLTPKSNLVNLAEKLATFNCMLIVDESFMDFTENPDQNTLEREIAQYPNIAIFKSMSKTYGICGLRIGYMLTANSKFAAAVRSGIHIWNINGFAEEFLRLLPAYRDEFLKSCRQVKHDRDSMYQKILTIDGMTVYKPDANYIFCRLPDPVRSAPEVVKDLFVEHNIYIKHCAGKTQPDADRYLRIACRTENENCRLIAALLETIHGKGETL
jgi:threonine-phosphate decarboxylase